MGGPVRGASKRDYEADEQLLARANSERKGALYALKDDVLAALRTRGVVDEIRLHVIDGSEYFCFYADGYAFHSPAHEWYINNQEIENAEVFGEREREVLEEFERDSSLDGADVTLRTALRTLDEELEVCANDYLHRRQVGDDQRYDAGWPHLD